MAWIINIHAWVLLHIYAMVQPCENRGISMSKTPLIIRVALPLSFDHLVDYIHDSPIDPGSLVEVYVGSKRYIAVVVQNTNSSKIPLKKIKSIHAIIYQGPFIDSHILDLTKWVSQYYHYLYGYCVYQTLPAWFKKNDPKDLHDDGTYYEATQCDLKKISEPIKNALFHFKKNKYLSRHMLLNFNVQDRTIATMINKRIIQAVQHKPSFQSNLLSLNAQQQVIVDDFKKQKGFFVQLIQGVTGCGKTEMYCHMAQHIMDQGKQILILVPQINLTPKTKIYFETRFGQPVALLHSQLSEKKRAYHWMMAKKGNINIIIATRLGIFTPIKNLGLIIVDEEHDASFKQDSFVRYHARDVAIFRAKKLNIPIIMGSATPSLESMHNAMIGKYQYAVLTQRVANINLPIIKLVDIKNQKLIHGFAKQTLDAIKACIKKQEQVLIFHNRRGYSHTLMCQQCNWMPLCRYCDAKMTYHLHNNKLVCHHCSYQHSCGHHCPSCHAPDLLRLGMGTEQIENTLKLIFPDVPVTRIDSDSFSCASHLNEKLISLQEKHAHILVGTQMLAKGHHFEHLSMVIIPQADSALYCADFRAEEHWMQTVTQVIGRAGRSTSTQGQALIQTLQPQHRAFHMSYNDFVNAQLVERKDAFLPPFTHMAIIRCACKTNEKAFNMLNDSWSFPNCNIWGPSPLPMAKKSGLYRQQLMIISHKRQYLHQTIEAIKQSIEKKTTKTPCQISIDIDPMDLFQ